MEITKNINNQRLNSFKSKSKCPTCKKKSQELFLPFCSKKCSDLDLIKWLKDEYFINFDSQKYDK